MLRNFSDFLHPAIEEDGVPETDQRWKFRGQTHIGNRSSNALSTQRKQYNWGNWRVITWCFNLGVIGGLLAFSESSFGSNIDIKSRSIDKNPLSPLDS